MDTKTRTLIIIAVIIGAVGLYSNLKNRTLTLQSPTNVAPQQTN